MWRSTTKRSVNNGGEPHVVQVVRPFWRDYTARCSCGWVSTPTADYLSADADAMRHWQRMVTEARLFGSSEVSDDD